MKMYLTNSFSLLICFSLLLVGCNFFGKKVDKSFIDVPSYDKDQVAFVPLQPSFKGFISPVDVIVGWDELIYVADEGKQELICLDLAGNQLGKISIPGIKAVAQNRNLDLFVIGTVPRKINNVDYNLSAIYRIDPKSTIYGLNNAIFEDTIVHPFYFKPSVSAFNSNDANVSFGGIGFTADNYFYVTRSGPNNLVSQLGGPDDALLVFDNDNNFVSPISVLTAVGTVSDFFSKPLAVSTKAQPPQTFTVSTSGDFFYTSLASDRAIKSLGIKRNDSELGTEYVLLAPLLDTSLSKRYLYQPDLFSEPSDVALSSDSRNWIFVVDSKKDSVFQFQLNNFSEGVIPPVGSTSKKNIIVSFGGKGTGASNFDNPKAVFYYDRILYVADKGNGRISRFKLTTDIL